jgi:hypothetical protein
MDDSRLHGDQSKRNAEKQNHLTEKRHGEGERASSEQTVHEIDAKSGIAQLAERKGSRQKSERIPNHRPLAANKAVKA